MCATPKVSVIIPVYNDEKYLAECLDSVTKQTLSDIEIICINDASTDASLTILTQYAANDARIRIINYIENKSASQARKDGVLMSSGEYIMFMDADDSIELTACEELASAMDKYQVDILQFGTYVDALKTVQAKSVNSFTHFVAPCTDHLNGRQVFEGCFEYRKYRFNLWNKIYKSDLCKKAFLDIADGSFPKAQDLYAYFIISWYAQSYFGIRKKYYHYNFGRGITGGAKILDFSSLERYCSQAKVARKCKEFLVQQNAWEQYKKLWVRLNRDLISECINVWLNNFDESNGSEGFDILGELII